MATLDIKLEIHISYLLKPPFTFPTEANDADLDLKHLFHGSLLPDAGISSLTKSR